MSQTRRQRQKVEDMLAVMNVNGKTLMSMNRNDRHDPRRSVCLNVLQVKSADLDDDDPLQESPFKDKLHGYCHSDKLVLDGHKFGCYSYEHISNRNR